MWFSELQSKMQVRTIVGAFLFVPILIPCSAQQAFSARIDPLQFAYSIQQLQFVDGDKVARGAATTPQASSFPMISDIPSKKADRNHPPDGALLASGTKPPPKEKPP